MNVLWNPGHRSGFSRYGSMPGKIMALALRRGHAIVTRRQLVLLFLVLLPLLLAVLGPLLGALAVAGVALGLELRPGQERPHLAQARHRLHPLPDAHLGHLTHQRPHLDELFEELLDLVRLDARAGRDPPAARLVDDVRVALLLLGHRVDHAL